MLKIIGVLGLTLALAGTAFAYPRYDPEPGPRHAWRYAEGAPNEVAYRASVFGTLGYSAYALDDENQYIDQLNAASRQAGGNALTGMHGGLTGGLGMSFGLSDFCQIGFEYEGLSAGTRGALAPGESATFSFPASEFGAFLKLDMPVENRWLFSFGMGLYNLWVDNATEKFTFPDGTATSNTFFGSTTATKLWAGGEYFLTRHLSLGLDAGYRFARINDVTDENGVTWFNTDGSKLTLDYSGPFARTALQFYF